MKSEELKCYLQFQDQIYSQCECASADIPLKERDKKRKKQNEDTTKYVS